MSEMSTLQRTVASFVEEAGVEMGDGLFALMCLANSTAVDLEAALDKCRERMALGHDAGSGG
jgi:hypothetical protein